MPRVVFLMGDYGHDPTETTVPYTAFKDAGFEVSFATENGKSPECDSALFQGVLQKLLGPAKPVIAQYKQMKESPECQQPLSWTSPDFSLTSFDLVFAPGGHDKALRQIIESSSLHKLLAEYVPTTKKPSKKVIGAICHGTQVLAAASDANGRSVIREMTTTTLPASFEKMAYWGTRACMGDYMKTYGAGSDDVETILRGKVADPSQVQVSILPMPFTVEDTKYNYISARYPADAPQLAENLVVLLKSVCD